jgi:RNA polymerase II subunit A-like phosphatase
LLEANKLYDISIYTAGLKLYATKIVQLLREYVLAGVDEKIKNQIFKRVLDRGDTGTGTKDLSKMFPFDKSMVLIVDDRDDVWYDKLKLT